MLRSIGGITDLPATSDGTRVLFEIVYEGQHVPCAISLTALEDIADRRCFRADDLLKCFAQARRRIEVLALDELRGRTNGLSGCLSLWADDIEEVATATVPVRCELGKAGL